jgi:hypothetical protein
LENLKILENLEILERTFIAVYVYKMDQVLIVFVRHAGFCVTALVCLGLNQFWMMKSGSVWIAGIGNNLFVCHPVELLCCWILEVVLAELVGSWEECCIDTFQSWVSEWCMDWSQISHHGRVAVEFGGKFIFPTPLWDVCWLLPCSYEYVTCWVPILWTQFCQQIIWFGFQSAVVGLVDSWYYWIMVYLLILFSCPHMGLFSPFYNPQILWS